MSTLLLMSAVLGLAGEKAGSEEEISWTNANPASAPSPRVLAGMAYDSESDRVILFGGRLADANDDETWAYDFNSNTWTNMNPSVKPLARNYPTMAYDSESDRIVLFGGQTEGGLSGETWAYDYNTDTWINMAPGAAPSPRSAAGMAYDAESDRIILFAGFLGGPGGTTFGDDTWA
ncbi:MAG: kelch repeat-containing protein [Thermoplasmata archaeon]